MPRTARATVAGFCYHVLNRGNGRAQVFHGERDYHAFVRLMRLACARVSMRVLAYCLLPNHFHLALWPQTNEALSAWMHWLLTAHVRRYRKLYKGSGHIWQARFKSFPIQEDDHLLTVLRYIERNPLRAKLVERAEDWQWSSLHRWSEPQGLSILDAGPVPRPADWLSYVNATVYESELDQLRYCVRRGTPYGDDGWTRMTATQLDLEYTLRPPGRPAKRRPEPVENSERSLFDSTG